jgi:hypothetical protein
MEFVKCPFCHLEIKVVLDQNLSNLIRCPYEDCKQYLVRHSDGSISRVIPVIPDMTREIPPIDYERSLTSFDYELASVARIKL